MTVDLSSVLMDSETIANVMKAKQAMKRMKLSRAESGEVAIAAIVKTKRVKRTMDNTK
jgi:hypothetical protein